MAKGTSYKKVAARPAFSVSLLVSMVAAMFGLAIFTHPRIWNPNLPQEFLVEPLAKSVIRKFDAYNMARGGRDDQKTFLANVEKYMCHDILYESVGFGTWSTPQGWSKGEETNYGNAFPKTVFTQMLFFGDQQIATTTTYGKAFWGGDLF